MKLVVAEADAIVLRLLGFCLVVVAGVIIGWVLAKRYPS